MQEEIERKAIAISVTATKLTAKTIAKVFQTVLLQMQESHRKAQTPRGRQSVAKLMNHGVNTSGIPLDGNTHEFDRIARNKKVDYAFYKTGRKKYLLFFKSGQADAITQCFSEYTKQVMRKEHKPSVRGQMRQAANMARHRPREHEHTREVTQSDR